MEGRRIPHGSCQQQTEAAPEEDQSGQLSQVAASVAGTMQQTDVYTRDRFRLRCMHGGTFMLGLMYLGAVSIYLASMLLVVRWAWRAGRKNSGSIGRGISFAILAVVIVLLPPFWNVIPTAMAHRNACAGDAGFRAFVNPRDWIASHQVDLQAHRGIDPELTSATRETTAGFSRYTYMGGLLAKEERTSASEILGVTLSRLEMRVVDAETHQVLAQAIDYSIGPREDARIWLTRRSCFSDNLHTISQLSAFNQQLKGAIK